MPMFLYSTATRTRGFDIRIRPDHGTPHGKRGSITPGRHGGLRIGAGPAAASQTQRLEPGAVAARYLSGLLHPQRVEGVAFTPPLQPEGTSTLHFL